MVQKITGMTIRIIERYPNEGITEIVFSYTLNEEFARIFLNLLKKQIIKANWNIGFLGK